MDDAFASAFQDQRSQLGQAEKEEQDRDKSRQVRQDKGPMCRENAVSRITVAFRDKDFFRCLELPQPTIDELDRPKWDVTPGEVSKAFRVVSRFVHPDKNPGDAACKAAFECLNEAYRALLDPQQRDDLVKKVGQRVAVKQAGFGAPAKGGDVLEQAQEMSERLEKRAALEKSEAEGFAAEIRRQAVEQRMRAKRRREAVERAKEREEQGGSDGSDSDSDGGGRGKVKAARGRGRGRGGRRPTFI